MKKRLKLFVISVMLILMFLLQACSSSPTYSTSEPGIGKAHTFLLKFDFSSDAVNDGVEELLPSIQSPKIIEIPHKPETCVDECYPSGTTCKNGVLSKCQNTNGDACMELVTLQCTYGCEGNFCQQEKEEHIPQSELLRTPLPFVVDTKCLGKVLGTVLWNTNQGLCRRDWSTDASRGYLFPEDCCQKYYAVTTCIMDDGIQQRGMVPTAQFHGFRCYNQ